jgi:TRAP-type C4-dicarboxylate transport system permease small subunit
MMLVLLGIIMTILILLQIFFRFVYYVPFPWSEECARYLMIWMGMLGSVVALQKGRHIGVTVLVEKIPDYLRRGTTLLVRLVSIGFLSVLFQQGIGFALFNLNQLSPAMEISMLIPYCSIPVGTAMMILVIVGDIMDTFFPSNTVPASSRAFLANRKPQS